MPSDSAAVVLVCQPLLFQKHGAWREILEDAGFDIRFPAPGGAVLNASQLARELPGAQATIASTEPYTADILTSPAARELRVISRTGVGFDSVDVPASTRSRIVVACTPGTNHEAVAEQAFALLLAACKRVVPMHQEVAQGGFRRQPSRALRGRTLGIIGFGRIGRAMAVRAAAFGMHVLAHDPYLPALPEGAPAVDLVSLSVLLANSDMITLHAVAGEETFHLIREETLAQMRDGVILVNTARGTLIDEGALCAALQSGKVAAAALDVFEQEPPVGSPLLSAPNVVLSPHLAGIDEQTLVDMTTMAAQTIVDLFHGGWPAERLVNATTLPKPWRWERDGTAG